MNDYVIITESSCDISSELAKAHGINVVPMKFTLDDKEYLNWIDYRDISAKEVYDEIRAGKQVKTAAINIDEGMEEMEKYLSQGHDVFWLAFSSALSSTYSNLANAAKMLSEKYPERKIVVVDSMAASLGEGMFAYLCALKKEKGLSIDELKDWAEQIRPNIVHWFTVDDLFHLKRGGRVSGATAVVGSVLGIKPVLHVNEIGQLINVTKARGRKNAILEMLERMKATAIEPEKQTVFISHGDCLEDAEMLAQMIREQLNVKDIVINVIGPVIGAHSGPGTLALFFTGTER